VGSRLREKVAHQLVVVAHDLALEVDALLAADDADELARHDAALVDQLVERVLAVRPRLAEVDLARLEAQPFAVDVDALAVRLHRHLRAAPQDVACVLSCGLSVMLVSSALPHAALCNSWCSQQAQAQGMHGAALQTVATAWKRANTSGQLWRRACWMCGASLLSAWQYGRIAWLECCRNVEFQTPKRPMRTGMLRSNGAVLKCSSMLRAPSRNSSHCTRGAAVSATEQHKAAPELCRAFTEHPTRRAQASNATPVGSRRRTHWRLQTCFAAGKDAAALETR
jgi:hypothetical protein